MIMTYGTSDYKALEGTVNDPLYAARRILDEGRPCPRIFHSIGTEDFLLDSARATRDFFTALPGNPFDYTYEEHPGAHTWEYWDEHIQDFLKYLGPGARDRHTQLSAFRRHAAGVACRRACGPRATLILSAAVPQRRAPALDATLRALWARTTRKLAPQSANHGARHDHGHNRGRVCNRNSRRKPERGCKHGLPGS